MNTIHSTDRLLIIEIQIDNMNKPNELDQRCPLKRGNTQSNYLVHNTDINTDIQIYEFQGFNRNPRISQYLE